MTVLTCRSKDWIPAFAGMRVDEDPLNRSCLPMTLPMLDIARTILMPRWVRLGMRLAALLIILKLGSEMVSPRGGAFARFEWWVPVSLIVVPWYFIIELKWSSAPIVRGRFCFFFFAFLLPGLLAVLLVVGIFVAHWIPVLRTLFR